MKNKSTKKLLHILNNLENKSELNQYINHSNSQVNNYNLSQYILKVCQSKGYNKSDLIKNSYIYRTYGYQILNGSKSPSRDKLIKICIGNNFNLDQANRALTLAKLGILYPKDPRDSIFIYALNNKLSIMETDFILNEHGIKLLIDC